MLNELMTAIQKKYTLTPIDSSEFDGIKISGMKFDIKAYEAQGLGHVSTMSAKGFFGLMKMDTLIIVPREVDLPLFSYDRIHAAGNDTLIIEFYDTLLDSCDLGSIATIKKGYSDFKKYEAGERWYDSIKLHESIGLKGKKKDSPQFDECCREYLKAYLDLQAKPVTDVEAKKAKSSRYSEGLLENGGVSTDVFVKNLGKEKTAKLFREILFKS